MCTPMSLSTYFIAFTELQVQPSTVTVLNAASYNTFSLVCTASVPANVTAMKQFVWRQGPTGSGTIITASAGTTITTPMQQAQVFSALA